MLRGINRQVIFEHPVDYRKFIDLLCLMVSPSDELGRSLPSLCRIYAYCLMPNHIHMIIQEKSENLSTVIHRIATVKPMVLGIQATFNFTPRNAVMKSCRPLRNLGPVSSSCHVLQVLVKRSFAMQKGAMVPDPIAPFFFLLTSYSFFIRYIPIIPIIQIFFLNYLQFSLFLIIFAHETTTTNWEWSQKFVWK